MKKLLMVYSLLIASFLLYLFYYQYQSFSANSSNSSGSVLVGNISEKYVMVTFDSGIDYWKSCLKGFEDSAENLNVSVEYRGATQYDVNEEITVLEQIIAKKPAGVAVSAIHPEALDITINKAVEAGVPIVLFDSGAPKSEADSFLGTDNYKAGVIAAQKMAELLGGKGEVAVVTIPNQLNHEQRKQGFIDTMKSQFINIRVVAIEDGKADASSSQQVALKILKEYPNVSGFFATEASGGFGIGNGIREEKKEGQVKIISFDTDKRTLDLIKEGVISETLAQGTWNMGYWSLQFLFHLHHKLLKSLPNENKGVITPLQIYMDTGITVVTKENVDNYYAK
jgi:ribose transport system substrate-binding protein